MHNIQKINNNIFWVGANDRRLNLFENLFPLPNGVSYNSYLITDEKTALLDTADAGVGQQFLENVKHGLNGRLLDYLVISHMEPDHCANIAEIAKTYKEAKIVVNIQTKKMLQNFFDFSEDTSFESRLVTVKEGDTISLGSHSLTFIMAPMVHWPEVMVAWESSTKTLFSADAFGTFGCIEGALFDDERQINIDEYRRYYCNIVGKYGVPVQTVLAKASKLDIKTICPLHGPILRSNIGMLVSLYDKWSRYEPEEKRVLVAYASMYGHTKNAADILTEYLAQNGLKTTVYDVSVTDVSYLVAESFRSSHLALLAPSYNGGLYPAMEHFLNDIKALNLNNRTVVIGENGSWAPSAAREMTKILESMKDINIIDKLTILSSVNEETRKGLERLAHNLAASVKHG